MDFDGKLMQVPLPLGWNVFDDKVFSTFEVHTSFPSELTPEKWPRESAGKVLRIAEIFQRVASLSEVENPDTTSTDFSGTWTRVGPWLPWSFASLSRWSLTLQILTLGALTLGNLTLQTLTLGIQTP